MALSITNKTDQKNQVIDKVYEGVKKRLRDSLKSVNDSHTYFKCGLDDDLSNYLSKHIDTPLTIVAHSVDGFNTKIVNFLEKETKKLFLDNKNTIEKVFRSNEAGNFLHYFIVLKKDTIKNRRNFFTFLREYDKELVSYHFPIHFDFISLRSAKSINISKEIALVNDEKPSSKSSA